MSLSSMTWGTAFGFYFTQSYFDGFGYFSCSKTLCNSTGKRD